MNALKQLAAQGMPTYQGQVYYVDTGSILVCGGILPYEIFQLFTDMPEVKKLYVFPYPFQAEWEKPLYFSFEPTEAAREEMQKYVERKLDEMCRIMREKSEGISGIIPKVEDIF